MSDRKRKGKIPRPCVARYNQFKSDVQLLGITLPECGYHVIFMIPMPKSWSDKKKKEHYLQAVKSGVKGDKDNYEKALLDSIYSEDRHVWDGRASKVWAYEGFIMIRHTSMEWHKQLEKAYALV